MMLKMVSKDWIDDVSLKVPYFGRCPDNDHHHNTYEDDGGVDNDGEGLY